MERPRIPKFGLWTGAFDYMSATEVSEAALELERLGYGVLWVPEVAGRDIFLQMYQLLASTSHIIVGSGIANIWARDAVAMRGGTDALAEAYEGRPILGLGVSHQLLVEGVRKGTYFNPLEAMGEYLDELRTAPYTAVRPSRPAPVIVGALGPKMLRLAGEKAAGALTYLVPPEHTVQARAVLGTTPLLCVEQAVVLTDDREHARTVGREYLAPYIRHRNYQKSLARLGYTEDDLADGGSNRLIDGLLAWGRQEEIAGRINAHLQMGADHVCIQVVDGKRRSVPRSGWREALSLFGL